METTARRQIKSPAEVTKFALAGNATITLVSTQTRTRFTYRIRKKGETPHFVSLLRGTDNESDYQFLGTIFDSFEYRRARHSRIGEDAPSAKAFAWFWKILMKGHISTQIEVWHEGRCGKCGRKLTVPESIESGMGPECGGRL